MHANGKGKRQRKQNVRHRSSSMLQGLPIVVIEWCSHWGELGMSVSAADYNYQQARTTKNHGQALTYVPMGGKFWLPINHCNNHLP
jgi:hypothetical protein